MKKNVIDISVIVPCRNEEEVLPILFAELDKVTAGMKKTRFEFIFVDDGSKDNTLDVIKQKRASDSRYRFVSFSRNFGKEAAILAGMEFSGGEYVAIMDADMQDPPALLPELYESVRSGEWDCAATRRVTRAGEPKIRSLFARAFYRIMGGISDANIVSGARDFRLMNRKMANAVLELREYNRFSKGIFSWVGFRTKWIPYENVKRAAGKTKWSFWKLFMYSIEGITAFSTAPLILASVTGLLCCLIALVMGIVIVVKTLVYGDPVAGYPSMMTAILFIGGLQLFSIGILGQYLAKTYLETKKRPVYLVKESE